MKTETKLNRRRFMHNNAALLASGSLLASTVSAQGIKKTKIGVIGCGSVSTKYFPHLAKCEYAELVSACDVKPDRAQAAASEYGIPNHYPHIDQMLAGAPFDLLVNLTDMQEHYRLNKQALEAGKNVWSEKPMGNSAAQGQELLALAKKQGVRIWGAPTVILSPQFAFMAKALAEGKLGKVACAHASYGHLGPDWSAFFYEKGGGSLPDLGVYNIATLTALLGPAKEVVAMVNVITPERTVGDKGAIKVTAEDNAMVTMLHESGALSHVQCGFNYFTAHEHDYVRQDHHTIDIVGTGGSMHLCGYDWAPHAVDLATREHQGLQRYAQDGKGYVWQNGASHVAECLATGKPSPIQPEHSIHVLEIMQAALASQETGKRITLETTFHWRA